MQGPELTPSSPRPEPIMAFCLQIAREISEITIINIFYDRLLNLRKRIHFSSITGSRIEMYGLRVENQRFLPFIKVFNPFAVRGKVLVCQ